MRAALLSSAPNDAPIRYGCGAGHDLGSTGAKTPKPNERAAEQYECAWFRHTGRRWVRDSVAGQNSELIC